MPTYEYQCGNCGVFEVEQRITEAALESCPSCVEKGSHSPVQRLISATAFQLKGGGWYKSDYCSNGSKSPTKESSDSSSPPESKATDTKSDSPASLKTAPCGGSCSCV